VILRDILVRQPDQGAYRDLVSYLLSFDRADEAVKLSGEAAKLFPEDCETVEDHGVVEAELGHDEEAAKHIQRSVDLGCPPFQWTTRGVLDHRLEHPAYAELLKPEKVVQGLEQLDDQACRARLELLRPYMNVEAAPAVTRVVLERRTGHVRLAGLGLLVDLGIDALPWWEKIVSSDDFILEKHALRRIRELCDPAFIPLLDDRLQAEQTPGNRALTQLTLGELLLRAGEPQRGESLMLSISEDHGLFPVALISLADWKEERGDLAGALALIEKARWVAPETYIAPERIDRLRAELGLDPAPQPEAAPTQPINRDPQEE
jgi:tetratricopeptide (TPR) repeat protein